VAALVIGDQTDDMMLPSCYLVSVSRVIPAERQALFDVVADPAQHPLIDGGGTVRSVRKGAPQRLALGAKFAMDMRLGADYKILNTVVEFEEGRLLSWRHFNGHVWRYRFQDVAGGTLVTEEWDARVARNKLGLLLLGFPRRNRRGMSATLERLAGVAADAQ
jgi:uncharacterized protein YndB with AHSA1/START domain